MSRQDMSFGAPQLLAELRKLPDARRYFVAYSGGADSTALLHAALELRAETGIAVVAVHVNHALHGDAETWSGHCAAYCKEQGVELISRRVAVNAASGMGLEAEARLARYRVFESLLDEGDVLLTGHHREDQAETVLLNLMRSSGVDGLAGMPRTRPLGNGLLARPLLQFPMRSLRNYLRRKKVAWVDDPSNLEPLQDRNYLRHVILPKMEERWPGAAARLSRSAEYCRQAAELLKQTEMQRVAKISLHPQVLDLSGSVVERSDFKLLLRQWLKGNGVPGLPATQLEEFWRQVLKADSDSHVQVAWEGWELHLFDDCLWVHQQVKPAATGVTNWLADEPAVFEGMPGTLALHAAENIELGRLEIRFRSGGETIRTGAAGHRRTLKNLLRELGIPAWLRGEVPLLYEDGKLVAIADLIYDISFARRLAQNDARLYWKPNDSLMSYVREKALARSVDPL